MSIATNSLITWSDLSDKCLNAIISVCCNIDNYASNVPQRMRSGTANNVAVYNITANKSGGGSGQYSPYTFTWAVNSANSGLISVVARGTVTSEWNTFLSAAGISISSRSNKLVSARDLENVIGLYMQFMSFHVKPVYSRRNIYNTNNTGIEWQSLYQGCKYVTGTCTPSYTVSPIAPGGNAELDDSAVQDIVNKNFESWRMIQKYGNPKPYRCTFIENLPNPGNA